MNHDILKQKATVQWPYHAHENNGDGRARLFTDHQFYTPSKKAIIHSFADDNTSAKPDADFPLILTTGRIRDQWHTMSKTGKVNKLKQHIAAAFLEIHPEDAAERNILEDHLVEITSKQGNARVKAKLSSSIKKGVVFMPMHWGKILQNDLNRANNLTSNLIDPISKEPDFKFTAVNVLPYKKAKQKIVVIGAGAGACGFVKSYRQINTEDEIEIFSKENLPFYNRVMLPDYISGTQQWQQLVKMSDDEELGFSIKLHRGVSIEKIDRGQKTLVDSAGKLHHYDVLIMATGSRSAMLRDVPPLKGIFSMRSRIDADNFKKYIDPVKGRIIIVGGGLLGIELAASLKEMKLEVTLIHRTSRLMGAQLDALGSQLLYEELADKGIDIYFNDEIERYIGVDSINGIRLKSGLSLNCQAIVMAVGTIPNIELAKACGLDYKRGVVVNEYLGTNDENIFAIGEIAEFKGVLYGITAGAEQQAEIVARFLNGDISKYYEGTLLMNILKMHGTDLVSLGLAEIPADGDGYEEVVFIDKAKRYYKKCIIKDDRLVGAILIGDKTEFLEYKDLIAGKIELSDKRLALLRSGKKAEPIIGKLVCSCAGVGEGNINQKIKEGNRELKALCAASGAGLGCGSCRPEVKALLEGEMVIGTGGLNGN